MAGTQVNNVVNIEQPPFQPSLALDDLSSELFSCLESFINKILLIEQSQKRKHDS